MGCIKKHNKTTPMWHHIDKYEIMDENRKFFITSILRNKLVNKNKKYRKSRNI